MSVKQKVQKVAGFWLYQTTTEFSLTIAKAVCLILLFPQQNFERVTLFITIKLERSKRTNR